jgi:hypothetical protein
LSGSRSRAAQGAADDAAAAAGAAPAGVAMHSAVMATAAAAAAMARRGPLIFIFFIISLCCTGPEDKHLCIALPFESYDLQKFIAFDKKFIAKSLTFKNDWTISADRPKKVALPFYLKNHGNLPVMVPIRGHFRRFFRKNVWLSGDL